MYAGFLTTFSFTENSLHIEFLTKIQRFRPGSYRRCSVWEAVCHGFFMYLTFLHTYRLAFIKWRWHWNIEGLGQSYICIAPKRGRVIYIQIYAPIDVLKTQVFYRLTINYGDKMRIENRIANHLLFHGPSRIYCINLNVPPGLASTHPAANIKVIWVSFWKRQIPQCLE